MTLYNTQGRQIEKFGYAAFGLTVVPYAVMSIVNGFANLLCPDYSAVYIVCNQTLDNLHTRSGRRSQERTQAAPVGQAAIQQNTFVQVAEQGVSHSAQADESAEGQNQAQRAQDDHEDQEFRISGTVGTLSLASDLAIQKHLEGNCGLVALKSVLKFAVKTLVGYLFIIAVILGIIGGLSSFRQGSSTLAQRVWTMMWLCSGFHSGLLYHLFRGTLRNREVLIVSTLKYDNGWRLLVAKFFFCTLTMSTVPAIGGFVLVAQMINSYGVCSEV